MENIELEKKKTYARLWKKNNPEKCNSYSKKWKLHNKNKVAQMKKEYRKRHPEVIRASRKRYKERRKDVKREKMKRFKESKEWQDILILRLYKKRYLQYKNNAKLKKREFSLSFEEFCNLLKSSCFYCGGNGGGIDRVDNSKGYTSDNVCPCCFPCNNAKRTLTQQTFIKLCIAVSKRHKIL